MSSGSCGRWSRGDAERQDLSEEGLWSPEQKERKTCRIAFPSKLEGRDVGKGTNVSSKINWKGGVGSWWGWCARAGLGRLGESGEFGKNGRERMTSGPGEVTSPPGMAGAKAGL